MSWIDQRMLAVDLETTSPEPTEARIVQYAAVFVGGGQLTEPFVSLVDPDVEIPAGATAVHGITTEQARRHGMATDTAARTLLGFLAGAARSGMPVIAMNARYDLTVLDRELRRCLLAPVESLPDLRVVDPLVLDKHLDRYRPGSRKLEAICAHYGATLDMAHDAAFDAIAAARAVWVVCSKADVVRRALDHAETVELLALRREWDRVRGDLPALHEAQVRWAREQAEGLEEHFARKGTPEHVPADWPVIPVGAGAVV